MPAPRYITINSDALTSAAFTVERPDARLFLHVPSVTAASVSLRFTTTSGTAPFLPLTRGDDSGAVHSVHSGIGMMWCPLPQAPTPWGLLAVTTGTPSQVTTFTLFTTAARW